MGPRFMYDYFKRQNNRQTNWYRLQTISTTTNLKRYIDKINVQT